MPLGSLLNLWLKIIALAKIKIRHAVAKHSRHDGP